MAPNNPLPIHGNEKTMNLNTLILTNIQSSPYFKVNLFELKTYHQVIDEIYYRVDHLEPWEKGSRKTAGQTGMCGGVRGVGAGGIVSSAYCLLYKLFTLKLTKKQLMGLLTHNDSTYIRALGFMYIRYTQNPGELWDWYNEFLEDEEELDVKAGGGHTMCIGEMIRQWMSKLEWYSTLFPRIPVPIQKSIEANLKAYDAERHLEGGDGNDWGNDQNERDAEWTDDKQTWRENRGNEEPVGFGEAERISQLRGSPSRGGSADRRGGSADRRDGRPSPPFDIAKEIGRESSHKGSRDKDRVKDYKERDHRDKDYREKDHREKDHREKDHREKDHREKDHREKDYREKEHKEKDYREKEHKEKDHRDPREKDRERDKDRNSERDRKKHRSRSRSRDKDRKKDKERDRTRKRSRSRDRHQRRSRSRERDQRRSRSRDRKERRRSRSHDRHQQRSHDLGSRDHRESSFDRDLRRAKHRQDNGR